MKHEEGRHQPTTLSFEIGASFRTSENYERLPVRGHIDADSAPS